MSEAHDEPVVASSSSPDVGARLKQAREAKKYTVAEVAAQLRLTKDIVTYLENQQWEKLHGRTYARGYFASYVKFLGLPFDEMLAVFNLEYSAKEPDLNLLHHRHAEDDRPFPWLSMGLILVVMLVIWLAYQQWSSTQLQQPSPVSQPEPAANEPDGGFNDSIVEPLQDTSLTPEEAGNDDDGILAEPPMAVSTMEVGKDSLSDINAAERISPSAEKMEENQSVSPQAPTPSTLRISFSGECWVEITNSDAEVLVSKVMQASESLELSSEQPLNILLGRANVARVIFNNEPVDLEPHKQGNVARLTLGVES